MRTTNNRIVLDLSKAQFARMWYVNQEGGIAFTKPPKPSVRGRLVPDNEPAAPHPDYPGETMLERARRLYLFDTWQPVCTFQLTANHNVTYTGKKATVMWKAWQERIFNKKK